MATLSRSIGFFVLVSASSVPALGAVQKAPYLLFTGQNTSMDVMWQSTITETDIIRWGTDTSYALGQATSTEYGSDHQHRYSITGLSPGVVYYYQVDGFGSGSFVTAPAGTATSVSLWAISDTQLDPPVHESIVGQIRSAYLASPEKSSLILHTGDWATDDTEATWTSEFFLSAASYPQVAAQLGEVPLTGARGNHEASGTVFKKYLPFVSGSQFYWSFDYGPVHVTVIDSWVPYTSGSAQYNWLVNDLATSTKPWKVVLEHDVAWSAGGDHENNTAVQTVLHPLFKQYRVDLVLNGHNHYYARAVVDGVQYVTNGGAGGELMPANPSYPNIVTAVSTHCFVGLDVADASLTLTARRETGSLIEAVTLTHDVQPPTVSVTSPAAGAVVTGTTTVTASASDDVGVTSVDFFADGLPIGSASGAPFSVTWNSSGVADGSHTLTASAYDARGNVGQSPAVTVTVTGGGIDTQAPTTGITAPTAGSTVSGAVSVTASATDNVAVTRVELYVDGALVGTATAAPYAFVWSSTGVANGTHGLTSKAYDAAGNTGTSASVNVTVANPTALANGVTVTFSGATGTQTRFYLDVPSGATNLQFVMSGGTGDADMYTKLGAWPTLTSYDCRPYAVGNSETCKVTTPSAARYYVMVDGYTAYANTTLKATFTEPDTTPPTVSVTAPAAGATVSGSVTFSASASDNVKVTKVEFYVDGVLLATDTTSPYSTSWASSGNGGHTLTAKAYDAAGNVTTSAAVSVTVNNASDTQAPTTSVTAPASGATVSGAVTFSASAADNVKVAKVEFYVDGVLLAIDTTSPYSTSWPSTSGANGSHSLTTKAYDAAGNVGASAGVTVTVNNGAPLANGATLTISGALNSKTYYFIEVPAGATNLVMAMSGGTGDADMYTRAGSLPTTSSYTCRPYVDGNDETCTVAAPAAGKYFIMIHGYAAYSGATFKVSYTGP